MVSYTLHWPSCLVNLPFAGTQIMLRHYIWDGISSNTPAYPQLTLLFLGCQRPACVDHQLKYISPAQLAKDPVPMSHSFWLHNFISITKVMHWTMRPFLSWCTREDSPVIRIALYSRACSSKRCFSRNILSFTNPLARAQLCQCRGEGLATNCGNLSEEMDRTVVNSDAINIDPVQWHGTHAHKSSATSASITTPFLIKYPHPNRKVSQKLLDHVVYKNAVVIT